MRIQLDPRTLVVIAVLVALVPTAVAALVWRTRRTYPGFGRWTLGNGMCTLCLLLISLRGAVSDWISIVLASVAAFCAGALFFQGTRKFRGLPLLWWPECAVGVSAIAAILYFRFATDDVAARTLAWSVALGSYSLGCGVTLLRRIPAGRSLGMALTGIMFALIGFVHFFRGFYVYLFEPNSSLFAPNSLNSLFFAGAGLVAVGWTFGFVLMTGERLLLEANHAPGEAAQSLATVVRSPCGTVPESAVREQVGRIVASEMFRKSARMERFLSLAVDRTLLGQPEKLKEYALGRDVFNRGDDYDPRADSIVRVEAQRLRRKLREYYESYGKDDLVIVEFHAGSYVPLFRYRDADRSEPS